jgi:hypothetical protein
MSRSFNFEIRVLLLFLMHCILSVHLELLVQGESVVRIEIHIFDLTLVFIQIIEISGVLNAHSESLLGV